MFIFFLFCTEHILSFQSWSFYILRIFMQLSLGIINLTWKYVKHCQKPKLSSKMIENIFLHAVRILMRDTFMNFNPVTISYALESLPACPHLHCRPFRWKGWRPWWTKDARNPFTCSFPVFCPKIFFVFLLVSVSHWILTFSSCRKISPRVYCKLIHCVFKVNMNF